MSRLGVFLSQLEKEQGLIREQESLPGEISAVVSARVHFYDRVIKELREIVAEERAPGARRGT